MKKPTKEQFECFNKRYSIVEEVGAELVKTNIPLTEDIDFSEEDILQHLVTEIESTEEDSIADYYIRDNKTNERVYELYLCALEELEEFIASLVV